MNNKMIKDGRKIFSIVLAMALILTLMPLNSVAVYADTTALTFPIQTGTVNAKTLSTADLGTPTQFTSGGTTYEAYNSFISYTGNADWTEAQAFVQLLNDNGYDGHTDWALLSTQQMANDWWLSTGSKTFFDDVLCVWSSAVSGDNGCFWACYNGAWYNESKSYSCHDLGIVVLREAVSSTTSISGTVTITGTAKVGQTLTASYTGGNSSLVGTNLTYKWYRDSTEISGATSCTYTLADADKNHTIKVKITGTGSYLGDLESTATATVTSGKVTATSSDFVYTSPEEYLLGDIVPSNLIKIKDGITGMGTYSVLYKKDDGTLSTIPLSDGDWKVFLSISEGTDYSAVEEYVTDDAWILHVNNAYEIIYDGNGGTVSSGKIVEYSAIGSGTLSNKELAPTELFNIAKGTLDKQTLLFKRVAPTPEKPGTWNISLGELTTNGSEDVIVVPYISGYEANSAVIGDTITLTASEVNGEKLKTGNALTATATREGYSFDGWYTEKDGGTKVTVPTVSQKLYAHWTKNSSNPPHIHDFSGEYKIIKEATATTEGKKETICKNGCGTKKVVVIPATGIAEDDPTNGKLSKDAEVAADAPVESATLDNSKASLMAASGIFTEEEKTAIANGDDAKVYLSIENLDESVVPAESKTNITTAAQNELGTNTTIKYMDVSLFKQIGNNPAEKVSEPGTTIQVTIEIPSILRNKESGKYRKYRIIREHDGRTTVIKGTFNPATGEYSFGTDAFSTYAIAYEDATMAIDLGSTPAEKTFDKIGDSFQITASVTPEEADQKLTYESSNPAVATVDESGKVTAVGNGTAIITIKNSDGAVSKTITITVAQAEQTAQEEQTVQEETTTETAKVAVKSIKIKTPKTTTLTKKGQTLKLKAVVKPSDASNKKVTWKSSNKKVATVDKNGKVTAISNGKAKITVTTKDGKHKDSIVITVAIAPTKSEQRANSLTLSANAKGVNTGKSINITWGKVKGADGYYVYMAACGSPQQKVKTVDGKTTTLDVVDMGTVPYNKYTQYKTYVVAYQKINGKKVVIGRTLEIHIAAYNDKYRTNAKDITLEKSSYKLAVDETAEVKATIVKEDDTKLILDHAAEFRFASSNTKVAKVDANGKITAVGKGTCTVYVYAINGFAKKVTVVVK